jgi:hypothetical protein
MCYLWTFQKITQRNHSPNKLKFAQSGHTETIHYQPIYYFLFRTNDKINFPFFFQLTIRVSDVNDNAPKFELPGLHLKKENIFFAETILQSLQARKVWRLVRRLKQL